MSQTDLIEQTNLFRILRMKKNQRQKKSINDEYSKSQCYYIIECLFFIFSIRYNLDDLKMLIHYCVELFNFLLSMKNSFKRQT